MQSENGAPLEIERKFLIEYPDTARLAALADGDVSAISQTYLVAEKGVSERVRARTRGGVTTYTHNTKVKLNAMKRIELEETIDRAAYDELLRRADPACRTIEKTRYCVREGGFVSMSSRSGRTKRSSRWNCRARIHRSHRPPSCAFSARSPMITAIPTMPWQLNCRNNK